MGLDNPLHIAFLLVILLLVFGAKRLPEMGRSLGTGLRGFKESINGDSSAHELVTPTSVTPETTHVAAVEPTPVQAVEYTPVQAVEHTPVQPAA